MKVKNSNQSSESDYYANLHNVQAVTEFLEKMLSQSFLVYLHWMSTDKELHLFLDSILTNHIGPYDVCLTENKLGSKSLRTERYRLLQLVLMLYLRLVSKDTERLSKHVFSTQSNSLEKSYGEYLYEKMNIKTTNLIRLCALYRQTHPQQLNIFFTRLFGIQSRYLSDIQQYKREFYKTLSVLSHEIQEKLSKSKKIKNSINEILYRLLEISDTMTSLVSSYDDFIFVLGDQSMEISEYLQPGNAVNLLIVIYECQLPVLKEKMDQQVHVIVGKIRRNIIEIIYKWLYFHFISPLYNQGNKNPMEKEVNLEQFFYVLHEISQIHLLQDQRTLEQSILLSDICKVFSLQKMIKDLSSSGRIDTMQMDYIIQFLNELPNRQNFSMESVDVDDKMIETVVIEEKEDSIPFLQNDINVQGEDDIFIESQVSQVKDLLPDLGEGFIRKCLEVYDGNLEQVINGLLEDSLPYELINVDRSMSLEEYFRNSQRHEPPMLSSNSCKEIKKRENIFDGDEMDSSNTLDPSRIWIGKKPLTNKYYADSIQEDSVLKDTQKQVLLSYDYTDVTDSGWHQATANAVEAAGLKTFLPKLDEYNDDYNDEYDAYESLHIDDNRFVDMEDIRAQNTLIRKQEEEDKFWESMRNPNHMVQEMDKDESKVRTNTLNNSIVEDSINKREERTVEISSQDRGRGGRGIRGGRGNKGRGRGYHSKNKNKAAIGNHNRKGRARQKQSQGMS